MGGQIDTRAYAAIAGTGGAVAALIRRLAAGYDGQRPAGLIAGYVCMCVGGLPQAGVRSGLVPATEALTFARLDRRLLAGVGMAWAAAGSGPGGRRVYAGQPAHCRIRRGAAAGRAAAGPVRWRLAGAAQDPEQRCPP